MSTPERIVCLTEETTELLYLLGEERRIVGISAYTVRPPEARESKPVVSAFIQGSVKKIAALEPDLVIGFSDIQGDLARDLIKAGLNVLVLNQRSLAEIFAAMILIGTIIDRRDAVTRLVDGWRAELERIRARVAGSPRPKVYFQEWDEPLITGIKWVSELIEIAGGEDVFGELQDMSMAKDRIVTAAEAGRRAPGIIVGSWCGKPMDRDWVRAKPEWVETPAVKADHVYEIDSAIILQPGPALFLEGVQELHRLIDRAR